MRSVVSAAISSGPASASRVGSLLVPKAQRLENRRHGVGEVLLRAPGKLKDRTLPAAGADGVHMTWGDLMSAVTKKSSSRTSSAKKKDMLSEIIQLKR